MAANPISKSSIAWAGPATSWVAITPSDSVDLAVACRGVYVGTTGNVNAVGHNGVAGVWMNVPAGATIGGVRRINATGTTADDMLALY